MPRLPDVPFRLVSMDPGGDTGLARFLVQPESFTVEETRVVPHNQESTPVTVLHEWSEVHTDMPLILLYEGFHVRRGRTHTDLSALKVISAVEEWMRMNHFYDQVIRREPVEGKFAVGDDVLERMGIKGRGGLTRHTNDALRHGVAWLARCGYLPVCRAAWPD